ncbi:hypothetical protein TNCV_4636571 [Trichonephila clavipes]|nr:hypothetical protein TNCV_4636571 [Trichonephila clavipes]
MILCVAELLERSKKGEKITDVARELKIAHSVVSRLWKSFKNYWNVVDGTGMSLEVRRPQKTDIVPSAKKEHTPQLLSSTVLPACNGVVSITIGLEQDWACVLLSDEEVGQSVIGLQTPTDLARERYFAYRPENIQEKSGPISDMQHHGWAGIMM